MLYFSLFRYLIFMYTLCNPYDVNFTNLKFWNKQLCVSIDAYLGFASHFEKKKTQSRQLAFPSIRGKRELATSLFPMMLKFQLGSRAPQHPGEFQEMGKSFIFYIYFGAINMFTCNFSRWNDIYGALQKFLRNKIGALTKVLKMVV
jgi:hypothetical protein